MLKINYIYDSSKNNYNLNYAVKIAFEFIVIIYRHKDKNVHNKLNINHRIIYVEYKITPSID